jgi:hypothetical protein
MVVYLAHPFRSVVDPQAKVLDWYRYFVKNFPVAPVADWILTVQVLDDSNPGDRIKGTTMNQNLLLRCDEIWLCGERFSEGMKDEALLMYKQGKPARSWLFVGPTPPSTRVEGHRLTMLNGEWVTS